MRKVSTDFLTHLDFPVWEKKAGRAREKLLKAKKAGETLKFSQPIWKEFKEEFLLPHNRGKCMFCEGNYTAGTYMDGEHYRPKAAVTEDRMLVDHPGYYWLAYEWQNLLLACKHCNSQHPNHKEPSGSHPGKLNDFPIVGTRIEAPHADPEKWWEECQIEKPLLLHPYFDDPEEHFTAAPHGALLGLTPRGIATINVCDLNRPALMTARNEAESALMEQIVDALLKYRKNEPLNIWLGPERHFSMYLNWRLMEFFRQVEG